MLERVGTLAKFNSTNGFVQTIQSRAFDLQTQISSGKKAQNYSGISDQAGRLVRLESNSSQIDRYKKVISQTSVRMSTMETQMNSMLDNAIKLKSTLVSALNNGNANFMALGQQADQLLTQTASVLNSTDGENYLFGGSRTNTPPVDLSELTTAATATTPDTAYYQGDDKVLFSQIDKNFQLDWGIKANDPAFEQYIRGMRLIKQTPTNPTNLRNAMDLIDAAISGLNGLITVNGAKSDILNSVETQHTNNNLLLTETIGNIEDTDILQATSKLSIEETLLQAAFSTIARISRISLAQYLN
ncbi:MAG: hypothetical protein LW855_00170 [Alphaproteobacteria bacterium]|jgi:flagellar hook-associated protein 3 FlgL|nr:hypothetical protein [Thalassospira sp.]MCE2964198.1 hypothetical protein [Alphaproteobacteria bacterium]